MDHLPEVDLDSGDNWGSSFSDGGMKYNNEGPQ